MLRMEREIVARMQEGNQRGVNDPMLVDSHIRVTPCARSIRLRHNPRRSGDVIRHPCQFYLSRRLLLLSAEDFAQHHIEIVERAGAVARDPRALHNGERFRFSVSKLLKILCRERSIRNILREPDAE
jgi:hypothetical protein